MDQTPLVNSFSLPLRGDCFAMIVENFKSAEKWLEYLELIQIFLSFKVFSKFSFFLAYEYLICLKDMFSDRKLMSFSVVWVSIHANISGRNPSLVIWIFFHRKNSLGKFPTKIRVNHLGKNPIKCRNYSMGKIPSTFLVKFS
jgi:hypothetical protein